jgi:lysophospholipase L1-like esterase
VAGIELLVRAALLGAVVGVALAPGGATAQAAPPAAAPVAMSVTMSVTTTGAGLRASDLPGEAGLPTPAATAPSLTLSSPNAGSRIPSPINLTESSPLSVTRGAHLSRRVVPLSAHSDSITPVSATAFQSYSVELRTDAPTVEIGFRGFGGHYRVWVDGHPTSLAPTTAPRGGAFYRLTVDFPHRDMRAVRFETDESTFTQFTVSRADAVTAAEPAGRRAVIIGDSFAEGSRAAARFSAFGQTLCYLSGWDDCWVAGSGGTGYLADGAGFPNRVKYRDRIVNDLLTWRPDVVVVTGGRNDAGFAAADVQAESLRLFRQIRAALPEALLITTSVFPSSQTEARSPRLLAISDAVRASSVGSADHYLDVMGANGYITGNGNAGAPTGTGNADRFTSWDGVHPTQAGHDELGHQLFQRLTAQLQP